MGKKFWAAGVVGLLVATAVAVWAQSTPFIPEIEARFQKAEKEQTLRFVYDVAVDGGTIGNHLLTDAFLPANAMITQAYLYFTTQFVDSGTSNVALSCEDAGNVLAAADITGSAAGATLTGVSTGSAATMKAAIAARCQVTATVTNAGGGSIGVSAGKLVGFLRYVIIE